MLGKNPEAIELRNLFRDKMVKPTVFLLNVSLIRHDTPIVSAPIPKKNKKSELYSSRVGVLFVLNVSSMRPRAGDNADEKIKITALLSPYPMATN